jgi:hypothetical protein
MQCACAVLYCHLWPIWLYNVFPLYLIKGAICGKKSVLNTKCVLWLSLQRLSDTFLILRRTERDMVKNVYWPSCKVPVIFCQILIKYEYSLQILEKYSNMKYHENPSNESRAFPWGRTDRQMVKLIVTFRNFAKTPKNWYNGNLETPSHLRLTRRSLCWKWRLQQ